VPNFCESVEPLKITGFCFLILIFSTFPGRLQCALEFPFPYLSFPTVFRGIDHSRLSDRAAGGGSCDSDNEANARSQNVVAPAENKCAESWLAQ
jgi:hypothetical protein